MKQSMKFATALAGAAVVVAGGTAFTANSMGLDEDTYVGTGETTVTGVDVTATAYTYDTTNKTELKSIAWTTTQTVDEAMVTITSTLGGLNKAADTCGASGTTITCSWNGVGNPVHYPDMDAVTSVSLTVLPQ